MERITRVNFVVEDS